ncbi:MAG: phosphotransferase [Chloroflexota bacterium]|nr:phosphotransferase [Chloroflexota bacterium]
MFVPRARSEIERAFPELVVREVAFLGAGVDSAAYLVDGAWVFRFPKRGEVSRALAREIAVLPKLVGRLPVATPRFSYVGHQAETGLLFAGYPLIPGEPLTPELFHALTHMDQERVLETLAEFLRGVHHFPVAEATEAGVEALSTRDWVDSCWSAGRADALRLLPPSDRRVVTRLVGRFLADDRNFASTPCLLYADFAPEHVLYDRAARGIGGIIDWGDLAIGDPDYDLLYLYQDYGDAFVRRLLAYYPHTDPTRLITKLRIFNACDYVRDVLAGGADPSEADAVHETASALRELLRDA